MTCNLRVGCVQLSPVFKDVPASIARADALIETSGILPFELHLLILPEMSFTGLSFPIRGLVSLDLVDIVDCTCTFWFNSRLLLQI